MLDALITTPTDRQPGRPANEFSNRTDARRRRGCLVCRAVCRCRLCFERSEGRHILMGARDGQSLPGAGDRALECAMREYVEAVGGADTKCACLCESGTSVTLGVPNLSGLASRMPILRLISRADDHTGHVPSIQAIQGSVLHPASRRIATG